MRTETEAYQFFQSIDEWWYNLTESQRKLEHPILIYLMQMESRECDSVKKTDP